jgi:hypothetical protein
MIIIIIYYYKTIFLNNGCEFGFYYAYPLKLNEDMEDYTGFFMSIKDGIFWNLIMSCLEEFIQVLPPRSNIPAGRII